MHRPVSRLAVLAFIAVLAPAAHASAPVLGPRLDLPVPTQPRAIAVADLDADSHPDLAVVCASDSFVTLFYGQGGGTFDPPVQVAVGPAPSGIAIADWNHDGRLDLIVSIGSLNPRMRAMLGAGGRSFVAGFQAPLNSSALDLELADFDGDGNLDVLGVESLPPSDGFILPGTANGVFNPRRTLAGVAGSARSWLAVLPYDANGSPDVYIPSLARDGVFYVQNGSGGFGGLTAPPSSADAVPLDFDQDGKIDLVTGGDPQQPPVRIEFDRNTGSGFVLDHFAALSGPYAALGTGDLDGNGMPDVVVERPFAAEVDVLLLSCSGSVLEIQNFAMGAAPSGMVVADVDGDGHPDVVTANSGGSSISVRRGLQPGPLVCIPDIHVPSPSIDFGALAQFQPSLWSVVVQNTGSALLHVTSVQVDNPEFVVDPPPVLAAIAPGHQGVVALRYRRTSVGTAVGTLTLTSDDPDTPVLEIALTGVALEPPHVAFDAGDLAPPPVLAFSDTTSRTLVVSNTGVLPLSVLAIVKGIVDAATQNATAGEATTNATTPLPVDRLDGGGFLWNIRPDGSIATGTDGAFAGAFDLLEYPPQATATLEDGDRTFDLGLWSTPNGLLLRRKVFVSTGAPFARWLEIVANAGTSTISYTVDVLTNMGGPSSQGIVTSNGDAQFTSSDSWVVFSDGDGVGRPAIAQVVAAGQHPSPINVATNGLSTRLKWTVTLLPGAVTAIAHWGVQASTQAAAIALAQQLALGQAGAFDGLDAGELALLQSAQPLVAFEPTPAAFTVPAGESREVKVHYRGVAGFDLPADVIGNLHLVTNDPFHPDTTVTLAMHILGGTESPVGVPGGNAPSLALGALVPNPVPAGAGATLSYTLASDASARVEAYDVRGRRLFSRVLEHPAPGPGHLELGAVGHAGIVWFRLVQDGREIMRRGVFLH